MLLRFATFSNGVSFLHSFRGFKRILRVHGNSAIEGENALRLLTDMHASASEHSMGELLDLLLSIPGGVEASRLQRELIQMFDRLM